MNNKTLLGKALLKKGLITSRQLNNAYEIHLDTKERLSRILIQNNLVEAVEVYKILADLSNDDITGYLSDNITYLKDEIDYDFIRKFEPAYLNQKLFLPLYMKENIIKITVFDFKNKSIDKFLKEKFGDILIEKVELSKQGINYLIEYAFKDEIINEAEQLRRNKEETALNVFTRGQLLFAAVLGISLLTGLFFYFNSTLNIIIYTINILFSILLTARLFIYLTKNNRFDGKQVSKSEDFLKKDNLPTYSILISLTEQTESLQNIILSLKKMDYPADRLEVILLVEDKKKDRLKNLLLEKENWLVYALPADKTKTEIQIYNFGLKLASGKYITIYKEHTIPEADQLKKAVYKFENSQKNYFCLQSSIEALDSQKGLFSKYLSIENNLKYRIFSYFDKGIYHYRTSAIRQYGGWDLYNTAENLEIIRKAAAGGYEIGRLDSKTYQLSSNTFKYWLDSFITSLKGYMQTLLVYNRNPISRLKEDGLKNILLNNFTIGGEFLLPLLYTCLIFSAGFIAGVSGFSNFIKQPQFLFTVFNLAACLVLNTYYILSIRADIKVLERLKIITLMPVHWVIKTYAFIKAILLLIKKPHFRVNRRYNIKEDQVMFMQINFLEKIKETN